MPVLYHESSLCEFLDGDSDKITMIIDNKDMEMKPSICFGKEYDNWLVSKCGKVWSIKKNKILTPYKNIRSHGTYHQYEIYAPEGFWEDGSGRIKKSGNAAGYHMRNIQAHKVIMDTWAPLYDNPPKGILWEEWEIVRDLPTAYNHISKTVCIDHIDDDPTNNHLDNLRRVTTLDNNSVRKARGI